MSKEIREQINKVRKQFLKEVDESYSPIGKLTLKLQEYLYRQLYPKINVKYHDYTTSENFELNSVNLSVENDQLYVSFIQKFESELKPLIIEFIKKKEDEEKSVFVLPPANQRLPRLIGEYDDKIVFKPGRNYGKKVITLKFDF